MLRHPSQNHTNVNHRTISRAHPVHGYSNTDKSSQGLSNIGRTVQSCRHIPNHTQIPVRGSPSNSSLGRQFSSRRFSSKIGDANVRASVASISPKEASDRLTYDELNNSEMGGDSIETPLGKQEAPPSKDDILNYRLNAAALRNGQVIGIVKRRIFEEAALLETYLDAEASHDKKNDQREEVHDKLKDALTPEEIFVLSIRQTDLADVKWDATPGSAYAEQIRHFFPVDDFSGDVNPFTEQELRTLFNRRPRFLNFVTENNPHGFDLPMLQRLTGRSPEIRAQLIREAIIHRYWHVVSKLKVHLQPKIPHRMHLHRTRNPSGKIKNSTVPRIKSIYNLHNTHNVSPAKTEEEIESEKKSLADRTEQLKKKKQRIFDKLRDNGVDLNLSEAQLAVQARSLSNEIEKQVGGIVVSDEVKNLRHERFYQRRERIKPAILEFIRSIEKKSAAASSEVALAKAEEKKRMIQNSGGELPSPPPQIRRKSKTYGVDFADASTAAPTSTLDEEAPTVM